MAKIRALVAENSRLKAEVERLQKSGGAAYGARPPTAYHTQVWVHVKCGCVIYMQVCIYVDRFMQVVNGTRIVQLTHLPTCPQNKAMTHLVRPRPGQVPGGPSQDGAMLVIPCVPYTGGNDVRPRAFFMHNKSLILLPMISAGVCQLPVPG